MKKERKENATLKRSCERKRTIFKKKILYEHHIGDKEHRVFLMGLACKKNALCAVGEGAK
jgi:hypothetical protein